MRWLGQARRPRRRPSRCGPFGAASVCERTPPHVVLLLRVPLPGKERVVGQSPTERIACVAKPKTRETRQTLSAAHSAELKTRCRFYPGHILPRSWLRLSQVGRLAGRQIGRSALKRARSTRTGFYKTLVNNVGPIWRCQVGLGRWHLFNGVVILGRLSAATTRFWRVEGSRARALGGMVRRGFVRSLSMRSDGPKLPADGPVGRPPGTPRTPQCQIGPSPRTYGARRLDKRKPLVFFTKRALPPTFNQINMSP